MPQSRRYKKKKSAGKAILAWIIVLAILAAGVFVFVSVFYEDAKKKLDEMNYPRTYSTYVEKAAKDYDLSPNKYVEYHKEEIRPYAEVLAEFKAAYEEVKRFEGEFRKLINL